MFHLQGTFCCSFPPRCPSALSHGWMQCPHWGLTTTREDLMIWLGATQGAASRGQQCPGSHAVLRSCAPSSGSFGPSHGWDALPPLSLCWLTSYSDREGSERSSPGKPLGSVIKMPLRMLQPSLLLLQISAALPLLPRTNTSLKVMFLIRDCKFLHRLCPGQSCSAAPHVLTRSHLPARRPA